MTCLVYESDLNWRPQSFHDARSIVARAFLCHRQSRSAPPSATLIIGAKQARRRLALLGHSSYQKAAVSFRQKYKVVDRVSCAMPFANASQIDVFTQYNYTYQYANGSNYFNGTISNSSQCYMLRLPYYPEIYPNGTLLNSTGCSTPINVRISHHVLLSC